MSSLFGLLKCAKSNRNGAVLDDCPKVSIDLGGYYGHKVPGNDKTETSGRKSGSHLNHKGWTRIGGGRRRMEDNPYNRPSGAPEAQHSGTLLLQHSGK